MPIDSSYPVLLIEPSDNVILAETLLESIAREN